MTKPLPERPAKPKVANFPGHGYGHGTDEPLFRRRDFPGDGIREPRLEPTGGKPAPKRQLRRRVYQDGERKMSAYSLDELLAIESEATMGRPGMPY